MFHTYDLKNFSAVRSNFEYSEKIDNVSVAKVLLRNNLDKFKINYSINFPNKELVNEFKEYDQKIYRYKGNGNHTNTQVSS